MNGMLRAIRALGPIDIRAVRRDSMLGWMVFVPLFSAFFMRWFVPPVRARILELSGFDIVPYYPVLLSYFFLLMTPIVFSMLIGFLLLDERDDNTLIALQITPMTIDQYVAYRVWIPVALTIPMMFIVFAIANLGQLSLWHLFLASLVAAPLGPWFGLFIATFAQNKVQGFALMKGAGFILFAPVIAFFIAEPWQWLFGIAPAFWPMKLYWMLDAGQGGVWWVALVGLAYQGALILWFVRRLNRLLHQ
jgi:fluoroquinolone transport system permease protein